MNLAMIISIAFRLDTPEARILRMWFVEQVAKTRSLDVLFADMGQNAWLN